MSQFSRRKKEKKRRSRAQGNRNAKNDSASEQKSLNTSTSERASISDDDANDSIVSRSSTEDIQAVDGFRQTNSTNCMHASKQMIRGYREGSNHLTASYPTRRPDGSRPARGAPDGVNTKGGKIWHIQVLYGEHASSSPKVYPTSDAAVKANTKRVMEALDIMLPDTWVLAGVKYHNRAPTSMNNDGITHHWLVIVDKLGKGRYQYHDVATGKLHEFTYDDSLGLLVDKNARNGGQLVTRIRVDAKVAKSNSRLATLAAESHEALGNGSKTNATLTNGSYRGFLKNQYDASMKVLGR